MSAIHDAILDHVEAALQAALIDDIEDWEEQNETTDPAKAGIVQQGPVQGEPSPDKARITVTVHENDPDKVFNVQSTSMSSEWTDEVLVIETGNHVTWSRRFTVKARCLLSRTKENLGQGRAIASTVRSRIEQTLLGLSFTSVVSDSGEFVSRGVTSYALHGETVQAGGPGSYDYHIKVRFEVLTTT